MSPRTPIRVAILADSPAMAAGLTALLASDPEFVVGDPSVSLDRDARGVGVASTGLEATVVVWAPAAVGRADRDPRTTGEDLDAAVSQPGLVVLLSAVDRASVREAVRAGAAAVLPAAADRDELTATVRAVAAGLAVVPREALSDLGGAAGEPTATPMVPSPSLTQREREVLALLVEGRANKVIAARLAISEHTVKTHVAAVYDKLGARNRAEAVVAAARHGLVIL